jgi:hypothetical protein
MGDPLRKKPLGCEVSIYRNSENALSSLEGREKGHPAAPNALKTEKLRTFQWVEKSASVGRLAEEPEERTEG